MQKPEIKYRMPAEWELHEATFLAWPHYEEHWPGKLETVPPVYKNIASALIDSGEKVFILVNDEKMENEAAEILGSEAANVNFLRIPTDGSWIRDHGPIFVRDAQGRRVIENWIFNAWGGKWPFEKDDKVPQKIAESLKIPSISPGIILEGGSIDVNGKGSLLTTEQCLLNKNRNSHLSRSEIENYLAEYLGATNVLWLREGVVGDDTDGHIDDIARFVDEKTVLCAIEENKNDENYGILRKNFEDLEDMRDQDGQKLNIVPLPMPDPVVYEDQRLPASYANFYISNKSMLVPTFRNRRDKDAIKIFEKLFKDRKIIAVDCFDLIWGLGAIHCSTQQMPACH